MSRDTVRENIRRFRSGLLESPWRGHDVVVVSSSTEDEAAWQQRLLDRVLAPVRTGNEALGRRVYVLSVVDPTEGGQVLGQSWTWRRAAERARERGLELDRLVRDGIARVAIYHNGGRGERASPLTQSLGNSRGSQRLVGSIDLHGGGMTEMELLLCVVLQTSALAAGAAPGSVDTFWTSQLIFDGRAPGEMPQSGAALEKFVVDADPAAVTAPSLHDFGTALLRPDGSVVRFFGNKRLAERTGDGGFRIREDRRAEWDVEGLQLAFDFGSYRSRGDLHLDLVEFFDRDTLWDQVAERGRVDRREKRDIDPDFIQPLVALCGALEAGASLPRDLPEPAALRALPPKARAAEVARARDALLETLGGALGDPRKNGPRDVAAFWLLHRDRPALADPARLVGSIRFAPDARWLTYRRPLDVAGEKLGLLAGLADTVPAIRSDGTLARRPPAGAEIAFAADGRALRGIEDADVARFHVVGRGEVTLTCEAVREGAHVDGVYVKGSIIRGDTRLLPGSRIVDSVLDHAAGRIACEGSWLEAVAAPRVAARASVLHRVIDTDRVRAEGEVVADAYRAGLEDPGFPPGQVRLRVPAGYDPQAPVPAPDGGEARADDVTRTEGGRYTLSEVRDWPSRRRENDELEEALRVRVLRDLGRV